MGFNVAIDGPAGAGKSTVAKNIAKAVGFIYVDTGAMYRAIGLYCLQHSIDIHDAKAVEAALPGIDVTIRYEKGVQNIILNEKNVSSLIRTQEVGEAASVTSAYPPVREKLLMLQRKLAAENDVLMDGRDIGTVILPEADLKIYLTASADVRAKRRFDQLLEQGEIPDFNEIRQEIIDRDRRDMTREVSPLKKAEDAVEVDSSYLTSEETVEKILDLIRERQS